MPALWAWWISGTIALLSSGSPTIAPTPSAIQVWISDSCASSSEFAWLSSSSKPRAWHSSLAPAISGAQMDALVAGWLKPIFFRLPVGFEELGLLLELVVPQAARIGPAIASAAAVVPARPRKRRRDSGEDAGSPWLPDGAGCLCSGWFQSMSASAGWM